MVIDNINVESNSQKGGITAGIVSIKKENKKSKIYYIAAIATIVAAILALLTYFRR